MTHMICDLCVVVWFLSVQGEKVVNINRILCKMYAEDGLSDNSTICRRGMEFLALAVCHFKMRKKVSYHAIMLLEEISKPYNS